MRIAWLTDLHLNFVSSREIARFLGCVLDDEPDVVLISGDIGEASSVIGYLERIGQHLKRPVYFVLGNHDFYRGSIQGVRAAIRDFAAESPYLTWLPDAGVVELTPDTALIGHDAWADGRAGDYLRSDVLMNDYLLIEEFAGLNKRGRLDKLHTLGDEAADYFRRTLTEAIARYRKVILVTHVPPFVEACWHEGELSTGDFLPHFVCQAAGQAMLAVMQAHPERELLVLCGHTHGEGQVQIAPNVFVMTGAAAYGLPEVQRVFELDDNPPAVDSPAAQAADAVDTDPAPADRDPVEVAADDDTDAAPGG
jgi:Icc protein